MFFSIFHGVGFKNQYIAYNHLNLGDQEMDVSRFSGGLSESLFRSKKEWPEYS